MVMITDCDYLNACNDAANRLKRHIAEFAAATDLVANGKVSAGEIERLACAIGRDLFAIENHIVKHADNPQYVNRMYYGAIITGLLRGKADN
jgi:hypothetical protein